MPKKYVILIIALAALLALGGVMACVEIIRKKDKVQNLDSLSLEMRGIYNYLRRIVTMSFLILVLVAFLVTIVLLPSLLNVLLPEIID